MVVMSVASDLIEGRLVVLFERTGVVCSLIVVSVLMSQIIPHPQVDVDVLAGVQRRARSSLVVVEEMVVVCEVSWERSATRFKPHHGPLPTRSNFEPTLPRNTHAHTLTRHDNNNDDVVTTTLTQRPPWP